MRQFRRALVGTSLAVFALHLIGCSILTPHDDAVGVGDDLGAGPCQTQEILKVPNRYGESAYVRNTACYGEHDVLVTFFVFVHRAGIKNSRENLVLRYRPTPPYSDTAPRIRWISKTVLSITTASDAVDDITASQKSMDGIVVRSDLGSPQCGDYHPVTGLCY